MLEVSDERFRAGVGLLVLDSNGLVLGIERTGTPGSWQLPQGGLHVGEEPLAGAYRELNEETGLETHHVKLLAEHPEWLAYELPEQYRTKKTGLGQVQKWFLFQFIGAEADIHLPSGGEARSWAWKDLGDLAEQAVEFRRPVYQKVGRWIEERQKPPST
jgi:putative (di)nucleoside polyphosphate hydrolase